MIRTVCALLAPLAFLLPVSLHAESPKELTQDEVTSEMSSNPELNGKTYGRVDFQVLDANGKIDHVETIFPDESVRMSIGTLSYSIGLPSSQWCPSTLVIAGATTLVYWCDPGNHNRLQSDVFQKLLDGRRGAYFISYKDIDCVTERNNIPPTVYTALCT